MNEVLTKIQELRVVPVVTIDDAGSAVPLAEALLAGGLPVAEITFRTDAAAAAIRAIATQCPDVLVGAGTVLTPDQADSAVDAGAKFLVSPGFNPKVVEHCLDRGYLITPGVSSPTQVEMGLERGLEVLKFFPAEASGGVTLLKAMSAPYGSTGIRFIPTGGISADNIASYLALDVVIACGGSWMVKTDLIRAGDFQKIQVLSREAVASAGGAGGATLV